MISSPEELVAFSRQHSPYYAQLYAHLPSSGYSWSEVPVVDQETFWEANRFQDNRLLTCSLDDGIVFRSGGTTGNPKFSVFTRQEWSDFVTTFGEGMGCSALSAGDRLGNLFYAGDLYASFLFISDSIQCSATNVVQFPISGQVDLEEMVSLMHEYSITTLAGVPTSLLALADHLQEHRDRPVLHKLLFGGESMYPDQRRRLQRQFPGVVIRSIGYASVDAGLLGYSSADCGPDEHRCFGTATRMEILDEASGQPIEEVGLPGRLVVTNLTRRLMPIVRYPCGDRAQWCEPPGCDRRFLLLGRSEEAARVGPVTLYLADVEKLLHPHWEEWELSGFQLVTYHHQQRDGLRLRIASTAPLSRLVAATATVLEALLEQRPLLRENLVHPTQLEWVGAGELVVNPRTGKLRRLIDERS